MQKTTLSRAALTLAATGLLVACDGLSPRSIDDGNGGVQDRSITIGASKGAIVGASCEIAPINNPGNVLDTCITDDSGNCQFDVPGATGPALVTCTGGDYYDEATDSIIALGNRTVRSVATSTRNSVAVTPLTDLLAERLSNGQQIDDAAVEAVAADISSFFAVGDITEPPQVVRNATDAMNLEGNAAGAYAAALGGFSRVAQNSGNDALSYLELLRTDIQDGSIDIVNQAEFDQETDEAAQGTDAAAEVDQNQDEPNRNTGDITEPQTGGTGGSN